MIAKRIVIVLALAILPLQAFALATDELLALVAMPLAVAAVSDVTGIPLTELANVAATLNAAQVPPVQFVEVMRYIPVALVVDAPDQPPFYEYLDSRYEQGISGLALVNDIERQLPIYGIPSSEITVSATSLRTVVDERFFPAIVTTRLANARAHPHGGPPGQLKKELGLQTGAEVVHGRARGSKRTGNDGVRPMQIEKQRGNSTRDRDDDGPRKVKAKGNNGKGKGNGKGEGNGQGNGKDHGKGKGKG